MSQNPAKTWPLARIARSAAAGAGISAVGNLLVFGLATLVGVSFVVRSAPEAAAETIGFVHVTLASVLPALFAGGLFAALTRLVNRPEGVFVVIASVFALLSMVGPINLHEAEIGARTALSLMHVISAAAITGALAFASRAR